MTTDNGIKSKIWFLRESNRAAEKGESEEEKDLCGRKYSKVMEDLASSSNKSVVKVFQGSSESTNKSPSKWKHRSMSCAVQSDKQQLQQHNNGLHVLAQEHPTCVEEMLGQ